MSNENVVVYEIRAAFERDPRIAHPAEVAVAENRGTVTLRGTVRNPEQRRTAVRIARSTRGVRVVQDELRVDPRDRWLDDELRGVALQALMSSDRVPAERIEATVSDSWLTLKGDVKHQYESDAAFEAAQRLPGLGGITNKITVTTAGVDG
jgi:osmotically-inducible protein OsmY